MPHFLDILINGPARYTFLHHFGPTLTVVICLGALAAELAAVAGLAVLLWTVVRNVPALLRLAPRLMGMGDGDVPKAFLELTFPADTGKSAFATEQLHILLLGVVKYHDLWDRLAAHKKPYSLELVGTGSEGIRYVLVIPPGQVDVVSHNLLSFMPGLKVKQIDDYLSLIAGVPTGVCELRLACDFVLPLQDHKALEEHDFMAFLTGQMTKLAPDEMAAVQIVAIPVTPATHHRVTRHRRDMQSRIALGREVSSRLKVQRSRMGSAWWMVWYPPVWFIGAVARIIAGVGETIGAVIIDNDMPSYMKSNKDRRNPDNPYERDLGASIKTKLDQQLYEVTIRILVASGDPDTIQRRIGGLVDSFKPFTSKYQGIVWRPDVPVISSQKSHWDRFHGRVLSRHHLSQQTILSSSELTDLYHFPNTDITKTEGLVKSRSRELATPLSIKKGAADLDVIVGVNQHGGDSQPIGMTLEQRQKHTYVIGKTGMGKTTLLTSSIYQDMVSGKGLAVFDPHGDMFQELLRLVPKHRLQDVVVFDPSDRKFPIGLNMLDPGIDFVSDDDRHEWITSSVLALFMKLADEKQWGPRMEHILRSATMTALKVPNPSLYTLQRLLTDRKYQKEVAKTLTDPVLKQFWEKEFKMFGSMQMSAATAPLTHRLGHFITTKMSRHILMQEKSTIRMSEIMDGNKILLVNLSKGEIGEDQSSFFGVILTSFIWMAAYQRTKIPESERRDFFVYVDEFQNFATPHFSDITSEGRKYHLALIVSHQSIAQIEDKAIVKVVASNASTIICLKVGPDDEAFILPYMRPEVEHGGIVNLAPYHFYMKTTGDVSEDAFSGITVPLRDVDKSDDTKRAVVASSRKQYATPLKTVEAYMEQLFGSSAPKSKPKAADKSIAKPTASGSKRSAKKGSSGRLKG